MNGRPVAMKYFFESTTLSETGETWQRALACEIEILASNVDCPAAVTLKGFSFRSGRDWRPRLMTCYMPTCSLEGV
jgi:hypothetical protein